MTAMDESATELLALRVATGLVPADEVEAAVDVLLAEGYRFWVCLLSLQLHRVLREPPPSRCPVHAMDFREVTYRGSILADALARARGESLCSAWVILRDGRYVDNVEYHDRDEALRRAWARAVEAGHVVGAQTLATMQCPPKGYAIVLVAGESKLPHRFTHAVDPC